MRNEITSNYPRAEDVGETKHQQVLDFDGATYDRERDHARLGDQLWDVKSAMARGLWATLPELEEFTGHPQASISARLRDLRKPKFGGYTIEREYVSKGLWRYRMVKP